LRIFYSYLEAAKAHGRNPEDGWTTVINKKKTQRGEAQEEVPIATVIPLILLELAI